MRANSSNAMTLLNQIAYVLTTAVDGTILDVNELFSNRMGIVASQLVGQSFWSFKLQEDNEPIDFIHIMPMVQETVLKQEMCLISHSKFLFWVEFNIQLLQDSQTLCWIGHDISYRKDIEKVLADNLMLSNAIKKSAPVGLFITDASGSCIEVNNKWRTITGMNTSAAMKQGWMRALHPEDTYRVSSAWNEFIETDNKANLSMEYRYCCADSSVSWVNSTASRLYNVKGEITGYIRAEIDSTERKAMEAEIKKESARMLAVMNTVLDGLITIDECGSIQTFNPAAMRIFGYKAEEVIGANINVLMPEPYHSEHDAYLKNYLSTGEKKVIGIGREVSGKRKDGSIFPMELGVNEMHIANKRMFVGTVRDITERKENERIKREFISIVSHELRTPLTSIRGSLGLIVGALSKGLPDKVIQLIDIAYKNCERLILLINDILDMDKIAAGEMRFDIKQESLERLLVQSVEANQAYAEKYHVDLELESLSPNIMIAIDANRFAQVLSNLLSNAVKFSPDNGVVKISTRTTNGMARINVMDSGPGISDEFRARIFGKFTQEDSSESRNKGGSGLGLNITKEMVEHMGGVIGFDTQMGKGSTFWVEFPIANQHCIRDTLPQKQSEHEPHCVLICDDDADIVTILKMQIEQAGFSTDTAYSIAEARKKIEKNHYVAITLDLSFPSENGLDFIRELGDNKTGPLLPIVVISAVANETKDTLDANAFGVVDWLQKPIDEGKLKHILRAACLGNKSIATKPRILYIEDDRDLTYILQTTLKDAVDVVCAGSLKEAREQLLADEFCLVVLDLGLPDGNGISLLNELHDRAGQAIPVLILSGEEVTEAVCQRVAAAMVKSRVSEAKVVDTILSLVHKNNKGPNV